jgi:hypothetical protein
VYPLSLGQVVTRWSLRRLRALAAEPLALALALALLRMWNVLSPAPGQWQWQRQLGALAIALDQCSSLRERSVPFAIGQSAHGR